MSNKLCLIGMVHMRPLEITRSESCDVAGAVSHRRMASD